MKTKTDPYTDSLHRWAAKKIGTMPEIIHQVDIDSYNKGPGCHTCGHGGGWAIEVTVYYEEYGKNAFFKYDDIGVLLREILEA